jgi:hypothetical protein
MSELDQAVLQDLANAGDPPPIAAVRRRALRRRVRLVGSSVVPVLAIAIALVVLLAPGSDPTGFVTASAPSTSTPSTSTSTSAPATGVSIRLDLPALTMTAGSSMDGTVVVENNTGQALDVSGCQLLFQVALRSADVTPEIGWPACLQHLTVPAGESRYPVTLTARYSSCSPRGPHDGLLGCVDGKPPAVPVGTYDAVIFPTNDHIFPVPPPLEIEVT